jgi:hypothetical protein
LEISFDKYPIKPEFSFRSEGSGQGKRGNKPLAGSLVRIAQSTVTAVQGKSLIPAKIDPGAVIEAILRQLLKESLFWISRQKRNT